MPLRDRTVRVRRDDTVKLNDISKQRSSDPQASPALASRAFDNISRILDSIVGAARYCIRRGARSSAHASDGGFWSRRRTTESGAGVHMALEAGEKRKRRERRDSGCAHERKQRAHSEERLPRKPTAAARPQQTRTFDNEIWPMLSTVMDSPLQTDRLFYYLPSYRVHRVHAVTPGAARGAGQRASAPLNSFCSCRNRAARPRDLKMVAIHGVGGRTSGGKIGARRPQYGSDDGAATRSAARRRLRERPRTDEPAPAASAHRRRPCPCQLSLNAVRDAYTRNTRWYL
ncbi:hypothetical protein EVAR_79987_1 [Eumeta japonica]|uniref:Uncharacterized protein n=1 Tax=Eumeta variegata TaxID=151549 RepID=A0A4C1ZUQ5_EUMVA|nr:hypothetical protein EVAR_79987_1 [Eumeta japonica]